MLESEQNFICLQLSNNRRLLKTSKQWCTIAFLFEPTTRSEHLVGNGRGSTCFEEHARIRATFVFVSKIYESPAIENLKNKWCKIAFSFEPSTRSEHLMGIGNGSTCVGASMNECEGMNGYKRSSMSHAGRAMHK